MNGGGLVIPPDPHCTRRAPEGSRDYTVHLGWHSWSWDAGGRTVVANEASVPPLGPGGEGAVQGIFLLSPGCQAPKAMIWAPADRWL